MSRSKNRARQGSGEKSQRQLRVGELVRHALTEILDRGIVRDPDLAGLAITVCEIKVSADLRKAAAYVMPLGGEDDVAVVEALDRAAPFLRRRIGGVVALKFLPKLKFVADETFNQASRIDALLREVRRENGGDDGP